jgi:hypothetical protein
VTGSTQNTMTVSGTPWVAGAYVGKALVMTSGSSVGEIRKITANTNNTLTVTPDFYPAPSATDGFVIADRGYRYFVNSQTGILLREGI